jgi:PAS domain S-box-containing protein
MRRGTALAIICGALILWAAEAHPAAEGTKRIALLFDERPSLPGLAAIETSFISTLTSNFPGRIEFYREAMDLSRFGADTYQIQLRDFLHAKYADKKIDAAIAVMGPALDFLLKHGEAIFPGVPVVFCGVDQSELNDRSLPPHVSGILVKRSFSPTVEIALGLHPDTQHIVVVAGTSEFDTRLLQEAKKQLRPYEDRIAFTYLSQLSLPQLLSEVSKLPPRTIVLFTTLFQDGTGEPFVPHDVVERLSAVANAPVYGFVDQYLGRGIVGGSLYSLTQQGPQAAKLALGILNGNTHSPTPLLELDLNQVLFDWRQLQRWGIKESNLPAGSQLRFRLPTVWEGHRTFVMAMGGALTLLTTILCVLLVQIARRKKVERALRESEERLAFSAASTSTGLWQYQPRTRQLWTTEQSRTIFGLRPKSAANPEAFLRAVHPDDRAMVAAGIRSAQIGAADAKSIEFRVLKPDGQIRWVLATSKLHLDGEGKPHSISGVLSDITARKTAEREADQLSERLSTIQDEERQQIALELHDSTAQHLAAACLIMMSVQHRLRADTATHELCSQVERSLEQATKELRTYAYLLNPPQLASDGLKESVRIYVDGFARRTALDIKMRISPQVDQLPLSNQRVLLRVVQEALANVHRHASASRVSIVIKCVADAVHVMVRDNGKGMDSPYNGHSFDVRQAGVGIPGMTARLRRLGGDLRIWSGMQGTTLHGIIPARESAIAGAGPARRGSRLQFAPTEAPQPVP